MQTFLPFADYAASAAVLDWRRLGKQRVETKQILRALLREARHPAVALLPVERSGLGSGLGWIHHTAVTMWRGSEGALALYGAAMCREWRGRGYNDVLLPQFEAVARVLAAAPTCSTCNLAPTWMGAAPLHASHRSNLLRKDPTHYGRFGWEEPPSLPYVWPAGTRR